MNENTLEFIRNWLPIIVSFLSLLISFSVLAWTIYKDTFHRGKIDISMFWADIIINGISTGEKGISVTLTNTGKEPISISNFGGTGYKKKNCLICPPNNTNLPHKLDVGNKLEVFWEYNPSMSTWTELEEFWVSDTFTRKFKLKKKAFNKVKEEILKFSKST